MSCIANVSFHHQCGHTSEEITHSPGCPTFSPYKTPLLGSLLNAVLPRTCISSETKYIYIDASCSACVPSGMYTSALGSQIQVFTIPELIWRRKEYKRLVNQKEDIERRHTEALAYGDHAETQWLQGQESERLLQERAGVPLKDQTLVYHPRKNKRDVFLQKSTLEEGAFCGVCQHPDSNAEGNHVRRLPCGHQFHFRCIRFWLDDETRSTCPACRHVYNLMRMPTDIVRT